MVGWLVGKMDLMLQRQLCKRANDDDLRFTLKNGGNITIMITMVHYNFDPPWGELIPFSPCFY